MVRNMFDAAEFDDEYEEARTLNDRQHDCAMDILCHAVRQRRTLDRMRQARDQRRDSAARAIQGAFRWSRYDPAGPIFKDWAEDAAARAGMRP